MLHNRKSKMSLQRGLVKAKGRGVLQRSTTRRKVNQDEHAQVPDQLRRWVWAAGKRLKGLARRRAAEAALYFG